MLVAGWDTTGGAYAPPPKLPLAAAALDAGGCFSVADAEDESVSQREARFFGSAAAGASLVGRDSPTPPGGSAPLRLATRPRMLSMSSGLLAALVVVVPDRGLRVASGEALWSAACMRSWCSGESMAEVALSSRRGVRSKSSTGLPPTLGGVSGRSSLRVACIMTIPYSMSSFSALEAPPPGSCSCSSSGGNGLCRGSGMRYMSLTSFEPAVTTPKRCRLCRYSYSEMKSTWSSGVLGLNATTWKILRARSSFLT